MEKMSGIEKGIAGMFNGRFIELFLCGETSRRLECEEPLRYEIAYEDEINGCGRY